MYSRILLPVDGSATAERGLREAVGLAREQRATLVLVHVVDAYPMLAGIASAETFEQSRQQMRRYGEDLLAKALQAVQDAGVQGETVLHEVSTERVSDAIVDEARNRQCELIVMGTHGRRGLSRLALGSDAEHVVRESPVPVLLVRHDEVTA